MIELLTVNIKNTILYFYIDFLMPCLLYTIKIFKISPMKKWELFFLNIFLIIMYFPFFFHSPFVDDGLEFVSAAKVLGIPHPSGYPLYTLLSAIIMRILTFLSPYKSVTLLTFFFTLLSANFLYLLFRIKNTFLTSLFITLLVYSNFYILKISVSPEVYSLHLLFFSMIVYFSFSSLPLKKKNLCAFFFTGTGTFKSFNFCIFYNYMVAYYL